MEGGIGGRVQVRYRNRFGRSRVYSANFEGVMPYLRRRHQDAETDGQREQLEGYMRQVACPACDGARLNPLSLAVTVDGHSLSEVSGLYIAE